MCHIFFILPIIALPLFYLLPFGQALFLYSFILLLCAIFYWLIWKDMRRPATTGKEGMVGGVGSVIQNGDGTTKVSYKGEIWDAVCEEDVSIGDLVEVTGLERMKVIVRRREKSRSRML
jgi:membrane protein implicated in regulation of membrane protease activity